MNDFGLLETAAVVGVAVACYAVGIATPIAYWEVRDRVTARRERRAREVAQEAELATAEEAPSPYDQEWLRQQQEQVDTSSIIIDVVPPTPVEPKKAVKTQYEARIRPDGRAKVLDIPDSTEYVAVIEREGKHRVVTSVLPLVWEPGDTVNIIHHESNYRFGGEWTVETVIRGDDVFGDQFPRTSLPVASVVGFVAN